MLSKNLNFNLEKVKKNNSPILSVIMPVFNGERYLPDSINSILNQSFKNFEFIIINDCSTDKTNYILSEYKSLDNRVIIINNLKNKGIAYSLNEAIKISKSDLIVRMDADDISLPNRLKRQFDFMNQNPDIAISGMGAKINNGSIFGMPLFKPFLDDNQIKSQLLFESPFMHPTIIFRKNVFQLNSLSYNLTFTSAQDYNLWVDFSRVSKMGNIIDAGIIYRLNSNSVSNKHKKEQTNFADKIRENYLNKLGINFTNEEMIIHNRISKYEDWFSLNDLIQVEKWLIKLKEINKTDSIFDEIKFSDILSYYWTRSFIKCETVTLKSLRFYKNSYLYKKNNINNFMFSIIKNKIKQS